MLSASLIADPTGLFPGKLDFAPSRPLCIAVTTRQTPDAGDSRPDVSALTDGQRDCLRLVYQHLTSKDIARQLGVSPHTVDMRLRTAMKTLGVASRIDAARLLVADEIALGLATADTYQPLVYQASELVTEQEFVTFGSPASDKVGDDGSDSETRLHRANPSLDVGPPASGPPRLAGASISVATAAMNEVRPEVQASDPGYGSRPSLNSLPWGARNDLAIGTRLAWIFAISVGSALAFGAILAALAALKSLI